MEHGVITVSHVPRNENPADIFTNPLGRAKFAKFREMLGLRLRVGGSVSVFDPVSCLCLLFSSFPVACRICFWFTL